MRRQRDRNRRSSGRGLARAGRACRPRRPPRGLDAGAPSSLMRTETRCTILVKLPVAFSSGKMLNCAPVAGAPPAIAEPGGGRSQRQGTGGYCQATQGSLGLGLRSSPHRFRRDLRNPVDNSVAHGLLPLRARFPRPPFVSAPVGASGAAAFSFDAYLRLIARLHQLNAIFAILGASDRDKSLDLHGWGLRKRL
jgi:hypothetical protein